MLNLIKLFFSVNKNVYSFFKDPSYICLQNKLQLNYSQRAPYLKSKSVRCTAYINIFFLQ